MKILIVAVLLFSASRAAGQNEPMPDSNFHLYLLVGQSNMAGRGAVDEESIVIDSGIFMFDKRNKWVPATDPVHYDKPDIAGVGPAISFAKVMMADNAKVRIGLIPCAVGGSPIRVWSPDSVYLNSFHPYDDAIAKTKLAMADGLLKGILWHQGESDNNDSGVVGYLDKLTGLIERFRLDFESPELPFVAGEIGYFKQNMMINIVIDSLPGVVANTAVVSAAGLTDKGDKTHFDTASARELGRGYAREMLKLKH